MLLQVIMALISSFGFGIIFNIRGKNLFFASMGGCLSWSSYLLLSRLGLIDVSCFFICSIIFSTYSEICARLLKTPVTTTIICALIPLVPGSGMYYTMYEIVTGNLDGAIHLALSTCASAGSLALGIILVSTMTKQLTNLSRVKSKLFPKSKSINKK